MPNKKISELPSATLPLGDNDLLEVVQGGVNKKAPKSAVGTTGVESVTGKGVDNTDPANPVITGIYLPVMNRPYSSEILFDEKEIAYEPHTLTDDVVFTVASSGHDPNIFSSAIHKITTDGTHTVTFNGYTVLGDIQSGAQPEAGTYYVFFLHYLGNFIANWTQPSVESSLDITPLSAPANFEATEDGTDEIDLAWDNVTNNSGYEIYVSEDGVTYTPLVTTAVDATSYAHTGLDSNTQYFYRIRAVGVSPYSNSPYSFANATTEDAGDVTSPVATFSPVNAATDTTVNVPIVITFDEAIRNTDGSAITNDNVASLLTIKEDNSSGADLPFTVTINSGKTQITINSTSLWGVTQAVYVAVAAVEDVNGNESSTQSATFTTGDFTLMATNRLNFDQQLDSFVTGLNVRWKLRMTVRNPAMVGSRGWFNKYAPEASRYSFLLASDGDDLMFKWYGNTTGAGDRRIIWPDVLDSGEHEYRFEYDGTVNTNDGLDRMQLYKDDVLVTTKSLVALSGTWPFAIPTSNLIDVTSGPVIGEVKDMILTDWSDNEIVNIPIYRTGEDTSGNNRDGVWV